MGLKRAAAPAVLTLLGALSACSFSLGGSMASREPEKAPRLASFQRDEKLERDLIANISTEGGIGYQDASTIAHYYLTRRAGNRGRLMSLFDAGPRWEGQVINATDGAIFDARIRIDKQTGGVSWGLGPTVRNVQELLVN